MPPYFATSRARGILDAVTSTPANHPELPPSCRRREREGTRELDRSEAISVLDLLARSGALGEESTRRFGAVFGRELRIDGR